MKMNWLPLILIIIGGLVVTVGDIVLKKWTLTNNWWIFLAGMLIYDVGAIFLAFSFKYKNIAVASVMFIIINVVALTVVSWFYFKEKLNLLQFIGILIGLISITFLELGDK